MTTPVEDFSQFGEQQAIVDYFGLSPVEGRGSWLEVGAFDGVSYSNTRRLMLDGWPGIAVEPAPDMVVELRKAVAGYPVEVVEAACVAAYSDDHHSTLRWTPGQPFSSLVHNEGNVQAVRVAEITVADLCARWLGSPGMTRPRFLSLDTEGTTLGLLALFLQQLGRQQLDLVCVEAHENVADERAVALAQLEHHGFVVLAQNQVNVLAYAN